MNIKSFPNSEYSFKLYINYDKLPMKKVKATTGGHALVNLGYFSMDKYNKAKTKEQVLDSTECDLIIDGKPVKPLQWAEFGICIDANGSMKMGIPTGQSNYCCGLPPQYYSGTKYCMNTKVEKNGCTHIGFMANGTPVIAVALKNAPMTNDELNAKMLAYGCVDILRYDGSWSSQFDFGDGQMGIPSQERIVQSYLLIYKRNAEQKPDTGGTVVGKTKLIALDAGHGKYTAGKRCLNSIDPNETREWFLNDRISRYVEKGLSEYDCYTMRVDDITGESDVPLATRVKIANDAKADAFISTHANAGINGESGGGICVFTCNNCSPNSTALQDAIYEHTVKETGLKGNRATPKPKSDFYVIKNTNMPAILGEYGFMDSTVDTPIILTDDFARKCAKGIVDGIVAVMGLEKKVPAVNKPWYTDCQNWVVNKGIADGKNPDAPATKAEVWQMLYNLMGGK